MTKNQRYQHEMLVRVRDFGTAHAGLFPESSPGGGKFAQVTTVVGTIEEHMKNRVLGHAGTRGVDTTTRAKVFDYMRTLAQAARQISRRRRSQVPFVLPRLRRLKVEVTTARAFLEEAGKRQAEFVAMGLPETFVSDFKALVDELDQAVNGRLTGKTMRGQARVGIADALRKGMHLVGDLDVIVAIAAREDDVVAATWRIARRVEGQGTSAAPVAEAPPATDAISVSAAPSVMAPSSVVESSRPPAPTQPPLVTEDVLGRAS
jgi:hypothetical protein